MTPLSPRLQTVFEKTKTVCFGDSSPVAPAGSLKAATGELCPATGEWECIDHGQAQRRHIRIGQVMPQGVFAAPQSTWQKLRGEAPTYSVHTVWTLVDPVGCRKRPAEMLQ